VPRRSNAAAAAAAAVAAVAATTWWRGVMVSDVGLISEVNQRLARLVLGWVTISEQAKHLGM